MPNPPPQCIARAAGACLAIALAAACRSPHAASDTIRVDGSPAVMPLVAALARAYEARHPGARVLLGDGLGASARLAALLEGRIDVALTSQAVAAGTLARQGVAAHQVANAAVVFAVPSAVPVAGLTSAQLCDAYAGRVTDWQALGGPPLPVAPRTRPAGEVDGDVALAGVPCLRAAIAAGGVRVVERPEQMAEELATAPGALGMTSLPFVERSGGRLRALALDGTAPTAAAVRSGQYPLVRHSLLLTRSTPPAPVARFLAFIGGAEGARVIAAAGAVPVP